MMQGKRNRGGRKHLDGVGWDLIREGFKEEVKLEPSMRGSFNLTLW